MSPSAGATDGPGSAHLEVDVPLSEHEQRLLEQIERALVDDDPKFASSVRTGDRRLKARRKLQLGAALIVVGLAVLVGGAVARSVPLGVFGFLVAFAGVTLGVLNYKAATGVVEAGSAPAGGRRAGGPPGGGRRGAVGPRWSRRPPAPEEPSRGPLPPSLRPVAPDASGPVSAESRRPT